MAKWGEIKCREAASKCPRCDEQDADAVDDLTRRHQHALHKIDVLEDIIEKLEAANKRLNEQMDAIVEKGQDR